MFKRWRPLGLFVVSTFYSLPSCLFTMRKSKYPTVHTLWDSWNLGPSLPSRKLFPIRTEKVRTKETPQRKELKPMKPLS